MSIMWFNTLSKNKNCIATIYDTNITLNKYACDLMANVYTVMLGLDYEKKKIYIRFLSKDMSTRGDIPLSSQYKITIRSSYGRISNVDFIKEVKTLLGISSLKDEPKKFAVNLLDDNDTLEIDLNKEVC